MAGLTALCVSLIYEQTGTGGLLHFNLEMWTQKMAALNFAFEVSFSQEYKKLSLILSEN